MQPFDLEKAKNGAKVVTRNGNPVRIICFDRIDAKFEGCVVALVCNAKKTWERVISYDQYGHTIVTFEPGLDLLINEDE